ncbi:GyrI-like domain-containing protein [Wukongibacter sp. M2B1]|uniref:GyrI-like domain-containing protein n=1 Tax=Wukongibacter sp. M2B1 TaxID=3088895 RepID=UPI003D7ADBC3
MKYEIIELKEKQVVGLLVRTTNENMQSAKDIDLLWQNFISKGIYKNINYKIDRKTIGLYTDYEKDYTKPYNFMSCCEVSSISDLHAPLQTKIIQAGKYAKFSIRGHLQKDLLNAWQNIWSLDLDRTYESDFEVYHNNSEDINDQIIDIYISIK